MSQLPLNIHLRDDCTLDSFYPADNIAVVKLIRELFSPTNTEQCIFLWGQEGVGRTHLLQAACLKAAEKNMSALYFPLKEMIRDKNYSPDSTLGLESISFICLDDIDAIASEKAWEEAIFHLFNRVREKKGRLLISGDSPPNATAIKLPDLKSRLSWGLVYQVHKMTDEQKLEALSLRAKIRGFKLSKSVGQFLVNRCPRNMTELFNTLKCLDEASLTAKRRLTIPFVKEVLKL